MPLLRQRQWHTDSQQQVLLEYASLKHACPDGIYLSLTPGNSALWSGVIFVRKGPYAPAVLRFQIRFPPRYPATPPSITFSSDIFHPLVTPLTTYTYTTGSSNSDTVSAADEERLRPGGFDLRHGFPQWFKRASNSQGSSKASSRNVSESQARETGLSDDAIAPFALRAIDVPEPSRPTLFQAAQLGIVSPQLRALVTPHVSIVEVLRYMKLSFEDATTLDVLPYDTVGNPGAWHAWRAHRKTTKEEISRALAKNENSDDVIYRQRSSAIMGNLADPIPKPPGEWNWDGVWAERVKKGVNATVSEPVLYGDAEDNELIRFLNLEDETIRVVKEQMMRSM